MNELPLIPAEIIELTRVLPPRQDVYFAFGFSLVQRQWKMMHAREPGGFATREACERYISTPHKYIGTFIVKIPGDKPCQSASS